VCGPSRALVLALALGACDAGDTEPPPVSPELREDVALLQRALTEDLELLALDEVDEALAADLPVRAGDLLEAGALPAARRHASELRALELRTERGRRLRERAAALLDARAQALAEYRELLRRGLVEDIALLRAIEAQREAEEAIDAFLGHLEELRPLAPEPRRRRAP